MSLATLFADVVGFGKARSSNPVPLASRSGLSQLPPDIRRLIRDRRYCLVLAKAGDLSQDEVAADCAREAIRNEMALVPSGVVCLHTDFAVVGGNGFEMVTQPGDPSRVESFYIDRDCVTNADFLRFVESDGYGNPNLWPEELLPSVLQFVDRTGHSAPMSWSNGRPAKNTFDQPVVGICWYEANAYATWSGKRLPSTEEWQRAGTWGSGHRGDGVESRYPWGNAFDPSKANLWCGEESQIVSVSEYPSGSTPNGVRQLIGNVWEWTDAQFHPLAQEGVTVTLDQVMAEIRGGAFDTYFSSQATCHSRSGQPLLHRGLNVGFRCCVSSEALSEETNINETNEDDFQ